MIEIYDEWMDVQNLEEFENWENEIILILEEMWKNNPNDAKIRMILKLGLIYYYEDLDGKMRITLKSGDIEDDLVECLDTQRLGYSVDKEYKAKAKAMKLIMKFQTLLKEEINEKNKQEEVFENTIKASIKKVFFYLNEEEWSCLEDYFGNFGSCCYKIEKKVEKVFSKHFTKDEVGTLLQKMTIKNNHNYNGYEFTLLEICVSKKYYIYFIYSNKNWTLINNNFKKNDKIEYFVEAHNDYTNLFNQFIKKGEI